MKTIIFLTALLFPNSAQAYINAVGGGLIFQVGYLVFTGILIFLAVPFKKVANFFRKKKFEDNHPAERD